MGRKPLPKDEHLERLRVGATIRAIRESKDFKADVFAGDIGISRPYLANIEAGRKPLTADLLARICKRLEVKPVAIVRVDYFEDAA